MVCIMSIGASVLDAVRAERALHERGQVSSMKMGDSTAYEARVTRAGLPIGELSGVKVESLRRIPRAWAAPCVPGRAGRATRRWSRY